MLSKYLLNLQIKTFAANLLVVKSLVQGMKLILGTLCQESIMHVYDTHLL